MGERKHIPYILIPLESMTNLFLKIVLWLNRQVKTYS